MKINYQRYTFTIQACDPLVLPPYKGSTIRGGFGNVFKRIVCALRNRECGQCILQSKCIYAYIFETAPAGEGIMPGMDKYEKIPHPFVIEPPVDPTRLFRPGETLSFNLVLVGRAVEYLPYFILTFEELGKTGIGKARGAYSLLSVSTGDAMVYSGDEKTMKPAPAEEIDFGAGDACCAGNIVIRFTTPTRIMHMRKLTSVPEFKVLVTSLLRRLYLLYRCHCGGSEPAWDHRQLIEGAGSVTIRRNALTWRDWERYSGRQKTRMKLGGFVGEIEYEGDIAAFLPFLRAGEILHVGKGTSFGLGKYELKCGLKYGKD